MLMMVWLWRVLHFWEFGIHSCKMEILIQACSEYNWSFWGWAIKSVITCLIR